MAGEQSSCLRPDPTFKPYKVKPHNKPVSTVFFNAVKQYMLEHMASFTGKAIAKYGDKAWWDLCRKEMDEYQFGYEGNQATFIYIKYKDLI
jgi:hypothetical protein